METWKKRWKLEPVSASMNLMPTNVGITARDLVVEDLDDASNFPLTQAQVDAVKFMIKSGLTGYVIGPGGESLKVDLEKWKATQESKPTSPEDRQETEALNEMFDKTPTAEALRQEAEAEEAAAKLAKAVNISKEDARQFIEPDGTASVAGTTSNIGREPVITISPRSPKEHPSGTNPKEEHVALTAAINQARERALRNPPNIRYDLRGWLSWKSDTYLFNPIRRAFGRPERSLETHSYSGGHVTPRETTSQGIGVSSTAQIGSAPRTISSVGAPVQEMVSGASGGSAGPQSFPVSSSAQGGSSQERGIMGAGPIGASAVTGATSPGGGASGAVAGLKPGASRGARNLKNGLGEKVAGLKSGITGGIGGLKNGLGGMAEKLGGGLAGKAAWAVDKAKTIAGAIAGNPLDIAKLGVDAIKTAWANKEKIIGGAMGVVAMPFLAMYAAIAPILGFLSGVATGVGSALASLAGIGSAVGGAFGGLGAALATPAFGIGVLSAGVVTFTTISATEQVARNEVIFGGQDSQSQEIIVEKTANPTEVDNDKEGSVVYTVKLANNSGTDVDIKYDDSKITVTGAAAGKTLTVPTANSPIPIKLSKSNDQSNPIVITYQPLKIPAGQFNDSQITNTASVTFADPTTNEEKTVTDEATVSIGGLISHPFGFPVSGILTSVDEAPCGDHDAELFYGVSHDKIHGLDIRPADIPSARVLSTVVGEVVSAEWRPQDVGGYVEILSKDGNFIAGYQHLYKPAVKKGDQVERGTFLGTIYNDILPDTTGPHLHYHVLQKINGSWKYVYFSDPSRAGACMADPVDSAEANIVPYVLTKPWFDRNTCAKGQTPKYTPTGPVVQDVVCK